MTGGNLKYKTTMSNGKNVKIDTKKQLTEGKHISIGEQIIKPHVKKESDYEPDSVRTVIENLIDKFSQNYKVEQYTKGVTISLVYLNEHNFPLYSFGTTMQKILPFYIDCDRKALVSGELWTAVFGKIGMPIFKPPEFEGAISRDGDLNDNGILITHSAPKAVCFYIEALNRSGVIAALIKYGEDEIKSMISKITDLYNDDQNSRIYNLLI
jgi:hypothetical protein